MTESFYQERRTNIFFDCQCKTSKYTSMLFLQINCIFLLYNFNFQPTSFPSHIVITDKLIQCLIL